METLDADAKYARARAQITLVGGKLMKVLKNIFLDGKADRALHRSIQFVEVDVGVKFKDQLDAAELRSQSRASEIHCGPDHTKQALNGIVSVALGLVDKPQVVGANDAKHPCLQFCPRLAIPWVLSERWFLA